MTSHRIGVVDGLRLCLTAGRRQHRKKVTHHSDEGLLLRRIGRTHKADVGGENRPPFRQTPLLGELPLLEGLEATHHRLRQFSLNGREIHDGGGDHPATSDDVGPKHRQIELGIWEEDAVKDLKPSTEAGGFQVQLAQAAATAQLIADEEILAIEAPADGFELRIDRQGLQLRERLPLLANAIGQGVDEGMNSQRCRAHRGRGQGTRSILPAEWLDERAANPLPGLTTASLPEPQRAQLSNGATVVQLDLPDAPVICLDFWCQAGSCYEGEGESGLAHFLEHMVFKGSKQLDAGEFDLRIEALGGNSNAATGFDDVHYHVLVPPAAAEESLGLLLDLVLQPRLDPTDFDMERQVVLEELAQSEDQPEEVAFQQLLRLSCLDHAYGQPILGERQALQNHSPASMAAFHQRSYRSDRCCLSIAGPLKDIGIRDQLEQSALAQLHPAEDHAGPRPLKLHPGEHRMELPRLEAARLLMAWQLPGAADQQTVIGGDLLTTLLAEGRRSRLVERLREQLRLVESIDLDLNVLESGCLVLLEAVCEEEQLPEVRQEVRAVLEQLQDQEPSNAELERAKRLVGNGYRFSLEAPGGVAAMVGNSTLWGRHHNLQAPLDWLEAWTVERLSKDLICQLSPELAFCLEAVPA